MTIVPKPRIAIGVDTFEELVTQSTVFVDKSLLVKEFLEDSGKVALITRRLHERTGVRGAGAPL